MDRDHQPANQFLRLDQGSSIIEGTVGLAIAFLLLALLVQVALATTARNSAEAAVAASARRAARPGADPGYEAASLEHLLAAGLPGARNVAVTVTVDLTTARATATFRWFPPGPQWVPINITVSATAARVVPP